MLRIMLAPAYRGRPEVFINQKVIEAAKKRHKIDKNFKFKVYFCSDTELEVTGVGDFYDNDSSVFRQEKQFLALLKDLQENDDILFLEAFNPNILSLRLIKKKTGKIGALFHSSVSIEADALNKIKGMMEFQNSLIHSLDFIFCATGYLKNKLLEWFCDNTLGKMCVSGLPIDVNNEIYIEGRQKEKENTIVFTHRWAEDKNPDTFIDFAIEMQKRQSNLKFLVLTPYENVKKQVGEDIVLRVVGTVPIPNIEVKICTDKASYFEELSKAKFVYACADLETFGYSVIEGIAMGALPILNKMPCYKELYPEKYLFDLKERDFPIKFVEDNMNNFQVDKELVNKITWYSNSAERIVNQF